MSFIFKITTTNSPQNFVVPCVDLGIFNATVNYGDGTGSQTVTAYDDLNLTHSFATAGQHTITINGNFPNIKFHTNSASRAALDEVIDLGDVGWLSFFKGFRNCGNLTDFNFGTADTSNVTDVREMFRNCINLSTFNKGTSDASNFIDMSLMFSNCLSLTSLDLSNFNSSSATNMRLMFSDCSNLTSLNLSGFDTSSVNSMYQMFDNCQRLTSLDLSSFDTSNVTSIYQMFDNCLDLTSLDLSNFDTSSVTSMYFMFKNCRDLTTLNISSFDTGKVDNMQQMFAYCSNLTTLDFSSFNTSSVTTMREMFFSCSSLTNLDIKHFDISSVTSGTSFLAGANNALTTAQYDDLLEAWAIQDVQPNVSWHFGDAQHTVENIADWYAPNATSSLSIINNKIVSIADSTSTFGASQQVDNLVIGNTYTIVGAATCNNNASTVYIRVSPNVGMNSPIFDVSKTAITTVNSTFIATATTLYVGVIVTGHAANDTLTIDASTAVREITNYGDATANSNIEYSQENVFGGEEVTNGDFTTDLSGYTFNASVWEWDDGKASKYLTPDSRSLEQSFTFVTGKAYSITVEWSDVSGGNPVLKVGNANTIIYPETTAVVIGANQSNFSLAGNAALFKVDNISVKEITNAVTYENIPDSARELYSLEDTAWVNNNDLIVNGDFSSSDGWTEGSSWTIGGGNATCTGAYSLLSRDVGDTFNNSYKVKYTAENWSSGRIRTSVGGYDNTTYQTGNGTYTEIMTASNPSSNTLFYFIPSLGVLSVDNISVKRVVEVADFAEPLALPAIASRNFLTLDPVLNSHYDMLTAIEFSNDFEIELDFSTTSTSNYNMVLSPNSNSIWIAVRSTGLITFRTAGGDLISTSQIIDGKLHTLKITRVGTTYNIYVDGVLEDSITTTNVDLVKFNYIGKWHNASLQFNGIIANAKFTDKSGASDVVTTFELDEATANTELSTEGNNSINYVNIPQSARKLFTLENDIWTDAAGNTIEVAP